MGDLKIASRPTQAATLMYALWAQPGIARLGGNENAVYKPNYLSIMNYSFTFVGLTRVAANGQSSDGLLDYSRFQLAALDEPT